MAESGRSKKQEILHCIRENPFISQRDLAERMNASRPAVAAYISALIKEGEILGRAYVLPQRGRILCIGGANVDRKIQAYEPIQLGTSNPSFVVESFGGVARNIAENMTRLGLPTSLVTMVGNDKEAEMILAHLEGLGTDVSQIIRSTAHRTGTYTAVLDVDGSMTVALADMEIYDDLTVEQLTPRSRVLQQATIAIVDTNLPAEALAFVIAESARAGTLLIVAPVSSPKAKRLPRDLTGIHTLIANRDEMEAISGIPVDKEDSVRAACVALKDRGCRTVVATMGRDGVAWLDEAGTFGKIPAESIDVVDVTGAGDAFVAGFCFAMVSDASVKQACQFAARLSSLTLVTKETVSTEINPREAQAWLSEIL
ncbi:carbohydrate kinase [Ferroacidibacillus organovorans]|uniref:Carbohydrate kinase PfkB domain-containing protein n=1 Tax=Ferroacidibacillus organovorans TaxID=1765683 RepID=A0A1V4EQZ0_9BACL|nr:carbohydrate kinase [Ferroacidibacillus organovorans]OPG15302.1 hypothetical protein B2M26_12620 [Ferroacidibacillus organovorans]